MCCRVEYKTGYTFRHKTGESIAGQPRKEELEEAKQRPVLGTCAEAERESRCVLGAARREGREEMKDELY